jgi:class 3 adenylate cyclase
MEPRIQYAKTEDGVNIAFYTLGEGMPVVLPWVNPFCHIQLEWRVPPMRQWYERLALNRRLVRYDCRGAGLSQRSVTDYSLEAHVLDLEAVVGRLELDRFALMAAMEAGPVAIAYAAQHPERVSHLVLWCSWARAADYQRSPTSEAFDALRGKDWDLYLQTSIRASLGWAEGEEVRQYAQLMAETVRPREAETLFKAIDGFDAAALVENVEPRTLVLHRRQVPFPDLDVPTGLASSMPNARLAVLEGDALAPWVGDRESVATAIDEFLGEGEEQAKPLAPEDIHTILFTDVEGSTALTERLGDAKARAVLREHERMVREALKSHGGSEVKALGDGFMTSFSSATKALECAIAVQRAFAERNESAEEPIVVRVGLNAGEPIAEEDDLYGTAVNRAARITATAWGGEILVANVVRELAEGKEFLFTDRGETTLKGFDEPVRLYDVRWREEG